MFNMENPDFLKQKYSLHNSPEVERAAERTEKQTEEKVPERAADRIQNYLDRFKEIIERKDPDKRERGVEALKNILLDKFVTKFEEIPKSFWNLQDNILRERGQSGDWNRYSEEEKLKERKTQVEGILADQRASLEQWIDYFALPDSKDIPDYLKYWVFRSVVNLAEYDKEKKEFPERSKGTVKMFPDINQEALAYVVDVMMKKHEGKPFSFEDFEYDIKDEEKEKFRTYLNNENFAKLYGWANEIIKPIPEHLLSVTAGEWRKYAQGSAAEPLVESIRGRGTGWCTAGRKTAENQLKAGDFYVFYSNDDDNNPINPRIAIRMENGRIAEVRGIAYKQNLDPYMGDVLAEKLEEFPDKEEYLKKDGDMKLLTQIDIKIQKGEKLTKEELVFLYEIESPIAYFGYEKDPRIMELREQRKNLIEEDMLAIFECSKEQLAHNPNEINENTKAYVGSLVHFAFNSKTHKDEIIPIFNILPENLEYIYTSFPEGKIQKYNIEIGGKGKDQLKAELREKNIDILRYTSDILESKDFSISENIENVDLVRLTVKDLGFPDGATIDEIYKRAEELGLELCPAEVGPHLRLQYSGSERIFIAMEQIASPNSIPSVFVLDQLDDGLWFGSDYARPYYRVDAGDQFVFRLRKVKS